MARKSSAADIARKYEETAAEFNKQYDTLAEQAPGARVLLHYDKMEFPNLKIRKKMGMSVSQKELKKATARMQRAMDDKALSVDTEERRVTSAINRLHEWGYD